MKTVFTLFALFALLCGHAVAAPKPNILFIAIDDQNDWIGHMGGHPLAKTPNLDKLAARGTTFLNAHCQSPLCNPSRASLMLGLRPTTTGIYGLAPAPRALPELRERVSLPQHFAAQGSIVEKRISLYAQNRRAVRLFLQ
jgi:choline-sulfatase